MAWRSAGKPLDTGMAPDDTTETETSVSEVKGMAYGDDWPNDRNVSRTASCRRRRRRPAGRTVAQPVRRLPFVVADASVAARRASSDRCRRPWPRPKFNPTTNFQIDRLRAGRDEVMDAVDASEPVDWVGNAWGGHVGLTLAAKMPERLRSVATIATPVHALTRRERLTIVPMVWRIPFHRRGPPACERRRPRTARSGVHAVAARGHRHRHRGIPQCFPHRHAPCDDVGHAPPRRPGSAAADDRDTDADGGADRTTRCCRSDRFARQYAKCLVRQPSNSRRKDMWHRSSRTPSSWPQLLKAFWRDPRGYVCGAVAH